MALSLHQLGFVISTLRFSQVVSILFFWNERYKALGIRLDSGDLAYLSLASRHFFESVAEEFGVEPFRKLTITASNDLNEETLEALNKQVGCRFCPCFPPFTRVCGIPGRVIQWMPLALVPTW